MPHDSPAGAVQAGDAPVNAHRYISAEHVKFCAVVRNAPTPTKARYAAMANHTMTLGGCGRHHSFIPVGPLFGPMERGRLHEAIERLKREHGLPAIRQTFGINYRRLMAEKRHVVPQHIG